MNILSFISSFLLQSRKEKGFGACVNFSAKFILIFFKLFIYTKAARKKWRRHKNHFFFKELRTLKHNYFTTTRCKSFITFDSFEKACHKFKGSNLGPVWLTYVITWRLCDILVALRFSGGLSCRHIPRRQKPE